MIHVSFGMTRHRGVQDTRPSPAPEYIFDKLLKHVKRFHLSQNLWNKNTIEENIWDEKKFSQKFYISSYKFWLFY